MSVSMLLLEKASLLPLVAAAAVITFLLQRSSGRATLDSVPVSQRIARAAELYLAYIGETVWPANLVPLYPWKPLERYWPALGAAAILLSITACAGGSRGAGSAGS